MRKKATKKNDRSRGNEWIQSNVTSSGCWTSVCTQKIYFKQNPKKKATFLLNSKFYNAFSIFISIEMYFFIILSFLFLILVLFNQINIQLNIPKFIWYISSKKNVIVYHGWVKHEWYITTRCRCNKKWCSFLFIKVAYVEVLTSKGHLSSRSGQD